MVPRYGPLKLKAQIFCGDEPAIGPGKADLLDAIDAHGSISAAGRAIGMSYRKTWLLVDSMNRCWVERLVETAAGGGKGGGARLTDCGRAVLKAYRAMEDRLGTAAADEIAALGALLRETPDRPPVHSPPAFAGEGHQP
jgi:molybdate transport system regulatory protein